MDLWRRRRERRVRSVERVRRVAPVRKMVSWLRVRVRRGGEVEVEVEGGWGVLGLDMVGRDGRARNSHQVLLSHVGRFEACIVAVVEGSGLRWWERCDSSALH